MSERFPKALGMPGAEALVRHLKAHNIPIAVGTSSSRNSFGHKTTLHREWFGLFDTIVTADDPEVGAAKPAPDIFLTAARRLGTAPDDVLLDAPIVGTAVAFGDDLRNFGVDAFGIQQQPVGDRVFPLRPGCPAGAVVWGDHG
jgi:FMN phosphatase YigB (HAD superfamily)